MKTNQIYLLIIVLAVLGTYCSNIYTISFPDKFDLPDKGFYTVFYIQDKGSESQSELPDFLNPSTPHKMSTLILKNREDFNELYGENIEKTPYFIFVDSEETIFQTSDLKEAGLFFEENVYK
ncbi:hypothetical protein [Chengkuizengella axinellae]|uniref:Lipoprotein n=1 Tax=Chengkuizengella axinellae TaxID=3064388 RepID=A0ABT9J5Y9_9BACL|nr:hypothetical protein [Chengkuizengella sp. 2205SS18-9]MDP5277032.1 hypothetical protein [Chengkuizengella sp. 2205SS18-9]